MRLLTASVLVRYPDFGLLWLGQTISLLGSAITQVAFPLMVLSMGATAVELGVTSAVITGSYIVLLLFGGALADRFARRRLLIAAEVPRGVVLLLLGVMALSGLLQVWQVMVAAILIGGLKAFSIPAANALVSEVVPREHLTEANSLRSMSLGLSSISGGAFAALMITVLGAPIALIVDGLSFLTNGALVSRTRASSAPTIRKESILTSIRAAFAYVRRSIWLRTTIGLWAFTNAVSGSIIIVGIPLIATERLGGAAALGGFASGLAAGSVIAASAFTRVRFRRYRGLVAYAASGIGNAGLILVPLTGDAVGALAGGLILGIGSQIYTIIWNSSIQEIVPKDKIGRVTSIDWFGSLALSPLGYVVLAALMTQFDKVSVLVIGALGAAAVKIAFGTLIPGIRDFEPEVIAAKAAEDDPVTER